MNTLVLILVVLYEVVVIVGVSWYIRRREAAKAAVASDFSHAGGGLGPIALGATIALTSLGGGHILGLPSQVPYTGMGTFWFTISSALMLTLTCVYTGPWYRRLGCSSAPAMFEFMYDRKTAILFAGLVIGCHWGVVPLEMQALGAVLSLLTGWNMVTCCIIGGIIGILYVVIAGMNEVAKVNVVNAVIMYIGVILAVIFVGKAISGDGGFAAVNNFYIENNKEVFLKFFANGEIWRTYIWGTLLGQLVFVPISQGGCLQAAAAKTTNTLRKAVMIVVSINCVFSILMMVLGLTSNAFLAKWPTTFLMLLDVLPTWVLTICLCGFAAAMLSTISVCVLCSTTVFITSIYKPFYRPKMKDKEEINSMRTVIIILSALATGMATLLPAINTSLIWLFAWMLAPFFMFVFGLHWKRGKKAAFATILTCSIVNCIWTFSGLPKMLNLEGSTNAIVVIVFCFVIGFLATAFEKNAGTKVITLYKKDRLAIRKRMHEIQVVDASKVPS